MSTDFLPAPFSFQPDPLFLATLIFPYMYISNPLPSPSCPPFIPEIVFAAKTDKLLV